MKLCVLCGRNKAEVLDRERVGRPIKRVCLECHKERLRRDCDIILADHYAKLQKQKEKDDNLDDNRNF